MRDKVAPGQFIREHIAREMAVCSNPHTHTLQNDLGHGGGGESSASLSLFFYFIFSFHRFFLSQSSFTVRGLSLVRLSWLLPISISTPQHTLALQRFARSPSLIFPLALYGPSAYPLIPSCVVHATRFITASLARSLALFVGSRYTMYYIQHTIYQQQQPYLSGDFLLPLA